MAGSPSTASAADFLPVGWDFRGFQTQICRWRPIVRKSTTSAGDHDVSDRRVLIRPDRKDLVGFLAIIEDIRLIRCTVGAHADGSYPAALPAPGSS